MGMEGMQTPHNSHKSRRKSGEQDGRSAITNEARTNESTTKAATNQQDSDKTNARLWSTLRDDETSEQSTSVHSRRQKEYWSTKGISSHQKPTAASQGRDFDRSTATSSSMQVIPSRANTCVPKARLQTKYFNIKEVENPARAHADKKYAKFGPL